MTFTPISKEQTRRGRSPGFGPRITMAKYKKATAITLNHAIMAQLGWKLGDYLSISVGSGADDGWLRIDRTNGDGFKIGKTGSSKFPAFKISSQKLCPDAGYVPATTAKHAINGGSLFVSVPSVLRGEVKQWTPAAEFSAAHNAWVAAE